MVFVFQRQSEASRFYSVLPKRLVKGGLEVHEEKSRLIPAGRIAALQAFEQGASLPTFSFLGFTCDWGQARNGFWRLKFTSRKDRFATKLKELKEYLRTNLNTKDTRSVIESVIRVVRGWVNYHGISDNKRRVGQFLERTKRIILRWLNRRGGKRRITWDKLVQILQVLGFPKSWKTVSMF